MNVWSNSQAVRDYEDFLANKPSAVDWTGDCPSCFIIPSSGFDNPSPCELLLSELADVSKGDVVLEWSEGSPIAIPEEFSSSPAPIYVCLPSSSLSSFVNCEYIQGLRKQYPASPLLEDFVFVHYDGSIAETILRKNNLGGSEQTNLLLNCGFEKSSGRYDYKLIENEVQLGVDAMGIKKVAGRSIACGKWAGSVKERIEDSVKRCCGVEGEGENWEMIDLGFYRDVRRMLFEYGILTSAVRLVGEVHTKTSGDRLTFNDVVMSYEGETIDLVRELSSCLRGGLAVTMMYGFEDRILALAESSNMWKDQEAKTVWGGQKGLGGVWEQQNGWWLEEMTVKALAKAKETRIPIPDPLPMHSEYLQFIGVEVEGEGGEPVAEVGVGGERSFMDALQGK
ncbi:hypothetical protein TrCOL_g9438 [Triparma columacea]|uniref:Uncharacterized protein n=1 Tax=Triparma columacea TaxID=722753 RepID=A0A9W7L2J4_9STRA|nr:hypothetical protein TrCOL_g9438 [Triparma columacea]